MKALTICQPYAELIARGDKVIENRTWERPYRGPLAIHAGKTRTWMDEGDDERYPVMVFGAIIAIATLVDVVRLNDLPEHLRDNEHANGPWCWLLRDVRRITPIAMDGKLGLWYVDITIAPPDGAAE